MKKVGLVSCYFIHSYGSMLQAYATQKVLNNLGFENETINVSGFLPELRKKQYGYILKSGISSDIFRSRIKRGIALIRKKVMKTPYEKNVAIRDRRFDEFYEKFIKLSGGGTLEDLHNRCSEMYSSVLLGSDQLWLPQNIIADYYTLNFAGNVNKVTYATSFGVSSLPENIMDMAKNFLAKIDSISVREQTGQQIIKKLTGRDVPVLCDPTLLLTDNEWTEIQKDKPIVQGPYIFCYYFAESMHEREMAKELAKLTGCKIVAIPHLNYYIKGDDEYADIELYDAGPEDWVNLVRNARYVCTDSYHGTVFSIIYNKDFFIFRDGERPDPMKYCSTSSRFDSLLNSFELNDRVLYGNVDLTPYLSKHIDYSHAADKLNEMKIESFDYLMRNLK